MWTDSSLFLRRVNIFKKLDLARTEWRSHAPMCRRRRVIVDGKTVRISGNLATMSVVDAPGKQYSLAFVKRTNLTIESPMMAMVGA